MPFSYDKEQLAETAELLKALAHPVRLCIVKGFFEHGACTVSTIQECLDVPQSTVSQHLARLRQAGIVEGTRHGVEVHYKLVNPRVGQIITCLFYSEGDENH